MRVESQKLDDQSELRLSFRVTPRSIHKVLPVRYRFFVGRFHFRCTLWNTCNKWPNLLSL